jgi:hypothetical protein
MKKIPLLIIAYSCVAFSSPKPDWVTNLGSNSRFNNDNLTGFGISSTDKKTSIKDKLEQAKTSAQVDLAQNIKIKVFGETITSTTEKIQNRKSTLTKNIKIKVNSKTELCIEGIKYDFFNDNNKCIYARAYINKTETIRSYKNKLYSCISELQTTNDNIKYYLEKNDTVTAMSFYEDADGKQQKIEEILKTLNLLNEQNIEIKQITLYLSIKNDLNDYDYLQDKYDIYFGGSKSYESAQKNLEQIKQIVPVEFIPRLSIIEYENCYICFLDLNTTYSSAEKICERSERTYKDLMLKFTHIIKVSIDFNKKQNILEDTITDTIKLKDEVSLSEDSVSFKDYKNVYKNVEQWNEFIEIASEKYNVDKSLIKSVIAQESHGKPNVISRKGAKGLMQLMDETARDMGVENSFDPLQNILGGTKYLRHLLDNFSEKLALASYNAGPDKVQIYKGIPPYKETRQYVKNVCMFKKHFEKEV